jgi:hypothetical protein
MATQEIPVKALLTSTALVVGLALPVMAQDAATSPFQTEAMGPSVTASDLIGARVYASEAAIDAESYAGLQEGWDDIGEVHDVILSRDGSVDAVLVDIGGFLGIGERQVAVDMAALHFVQDDATDADDWFLVLQADRATLDTAPEWVIPGAEPQVDASTDAGTDVVPTEDATGDQAVATDTEVAPATTEDQAATETLTEDPVTEDQAADVTATDPTATDPATGSTATGSTAADTTVVDPNATDATTTDTAATEGTMAFPEGYAEVNREELTAELLTGANVHDMTDKSIAEVSDLVLTDDGQVTDVILDVGGFLGIGARTVAIPMDRLTVARNDAGDITLWVDMTKEELEALPEHEM